MDTSHATAMVQFNVEMDMKTPLTSAEMVSCYLSKGITEINYYLNNIKYSIYYIVFVHRPSY